MEQYFSYRDDDLFFHHTIDLSPDQNLFKMHTHDLFELYYFISGKGVFHIEGNDYPLQEGELLLMRPTEAHYPEIDSRYPYRRMAIHFHQSLLPADSRHILLQPFLAREGGQQNRYSPTHFENDNYLRFLKNMVRPSAHPRLQIVSNLQPLLYEIYLAFQTGAPAETNVPTSVIYHIIRYANEHLFDDISLEGICSHFFISKSQLCRQFKRATGSTVWEYITVKRLIAAREMINAGTATTAAAMQCGFGEYSAFYRAYRKHFGEPPTGR